MRLSESNAERLVVEARERANYTLSSTDLFEDLGVGVLSSGARSLARLTLELCDQLKAEQSARRSLQERAEKLQSIVGEYAYWECFEEEFLDLRNSSLGLPV